jgi:outer membrane protein OmpA-like peptidoglycan-associated protein
LSEPAQADTEETDTTDDAATDEEPAQTAGAKTQEEKDDDTGAGQDQTTEAENEQQDEKTESGQADTADKPAEEAEAETDAAAGNAADDAEQQASSQQDTDNTDKVTLDTSGSQQSSGSINKARLYFPFRSSEPELADDVVSYFDLIIKQLKDNPEVKIRVTGHTDSVGRGAANRRLGRERAEQVRDMLVKQGAPKAQILVDSKGEGEPIADNQTDAGRKKNRRVELEQVEE